MNESLLPETRYTQGGDVAIAYQAFGDGPIDVVFMRSAIHHVEMQWEEPRFAAFLRSLSLFARVAVFDPRGGGLSDPFPGGGVPTLEDWADDTLAVMEAAKFDRAVIVATGAATIRAILFAATHPERVSSLVICNGVARFARDEDYPYGLDVAHWDALAADITEWWAWRPWPETAEHDPVLAAWEPRYRRNSVPPATGAAILRQVGRMDVRHLLGAVHVPVLVVKHDNGPDAARHLADHLSAATLVEVPGRVLAEWRFDDPSLVADEIQRFVLGSLRHTAVDRVLATVLFTDIVDSTRVVAATGDRNWSATLDVLDRIVADETERRRGRVIKSTGDGHLATFDGPGRAIACARALCDRVTELGLTLRAGLHTGEIEIRGGDIGGIAVNIARRVCDSAEDGTVFVSSAVPPLVAGSPIAFDDRGSYELKGVPGAWQLFVVR